MRVFELLKKAVEHDAFGADDNDLQSYVIDLLTDLDAELTTEEYDPGVKILDLEDKLAIELVEVDEEDDDEDDDDGIVDLDEDDDDDDDFEGIDEDDDDEDEGKK